MQALTGSIETCHPHVLERAAYLALDVAGHSLFLERLSFVKVLFTLSHRDLRFNQGALTIQ